MLGQEGGAPVVRSTAQTGGASQRPGGGRHAAARQCASCSMRAAHGLSTRWLGSLLSPAAPRAEARLCFAKPQSPPQAGHSLLPNMASVCGMQLGAPSFAQGQRVRAAARSSARPARPAVRCQAGATAAAPAGEPGRLGGVRSGAGPCMSPPAGRRRQPTVRRAACPLQSPRCSSTTAPWTRWTLRSPRSSAARRSARCGAHPPPTVGPRLALVAWAFGCLAALDAADQQTRETGRP